PLARLGDASESEVVRRDRRARPFHAATPRQARQSAACDVREHRGSRLRRVCRLVMEGVWRPRREPDWSWAPGESAPTAIRVSAGAANAFGRVVAARDSGGRLVVAYSAQDARGGLVAGLARGDARGGNLHVVSSLAIPAEIGSSQNPAELTVGPFGTFGPNGF